MIEDRDRSTRRIQKSREHLQSGGLPCSIGTDKADELSLFNIERDLLDCSLGFVGTLKEGLDRSGEPFFLFVDMVFLREILYGDGWHRIL